MKTSQRRAIVAFVLACLMLVGTLPVSANTRRVEDPRDQSVNEGGWDIKSAAHGHTSTGKLKHTFKSYTPINEIMQACLSIVTSKGEKFSTCGYQMSDANGKAVGTVREKRPDGRTIILIFPKRAIGNPAGYRWSMETWGYCQPCDRIPNSGRVRHGL